MTPSPPTATTGNAAADAGQQSANGPPGGPAAGPTLNGALGGDASGQASGANASGSQSLLGGGEFSDQFATDADIDWMTNFANADGLDVFGLYLENIGDENEGEVGIA